MTKRLLTPIALLLLIALAIGGWWSSRRSSATGSATIAAVAEAPPPSPPTESESTSLESVDPTVSRRASSAAELFASPALPTGGSGSIAGRVLSLDPGGKQVTAGFARIALAPAVPGSVRDEAEEQRLYIALPVAVIDREGRFTLPRVPLGEWIVSIEPDGFERRQTSVTVANESPATPVEFHTVRALSTLLTVVLQDPTGAGLFEERSGLDLETKMALRTVFLEACPSLGSDLPAKPRELKYSGRERNPRPSGLWTTIAFPEPLSGCACVVLGTRVLDAAPFVAGQESVVLHVSVESIQRERRTLQVLVRDSAGLAPLPNAIVKFEPPFGRQRVQYSNSNGLATADDLLAGDLFVAVELAGYVTERVGVTLGASPQPLVRTVLLSRAFSIRGRTRFAGKAPGHVVLVSYLVDPPNEAGSRRIGEFIVKSGEFSVDGLRPGAYMIGVANSPARPDPARVRRNEVDGWVWVDLTRGDVDGVTLDVSAALGEIIGSELEVNSQLFQELMQER
jgi:hypothetical protein